VAVVAAPTADADEDPIDDALVGVDFTRYEVPDTERSPTTTSTNLRDAQA